MPLLLVLILAPRQDIVDETNGIALKPPGPGWTATRSYLGRPVSATYVRESDGAVVDVRVMRPEPGSRFTRDAEGLLKSIEEQAGEKPRDVEEGWGEGKYWMIYTVSAPLGPKRTKVVWLDKGDRWFAFRCTADEKSFKRPLEHVFDRWVESAEIRPQGAAVTTAGWILGAGGVLATILTMMIVRRRRNA